MASILIVEDEEPINRLIKQNLALSGHICEQIYDGAEAKEHLLSGKVYDLIIMDVMLPHIDGFSLMQYAGDMPVIFLTAKSQLSDKLTGLSSGAWDYFWRQDLFFLIIWNRRRNRRKPTAIFSARIWSMIWTF